MLTLVYLLYMALADAQQFCISPTPICECFVDEDGMKVINCRYKGLTQIPVFSHTGQIYDRIIFTSTEQTGTCLPESSCNNITRLHADAFANLDVKIIDLRNNPIDKVDPNAFRGLEVTLNVLLVEGNGITSPPYASISILKKLLSLHLEHFRQIQMEDTNTPLHFPELITLTLEKINGLETILPTAFSSIRKVTHLFLQHLSSMRTLPVAAILNLPSLHVLNIADTEITRIYGDSLRSLNYLNTIEIRDNRDLVAIDAHAFRGVEDSLESLMLTENSLSSSVLDKFHTLTWSSLKQLNLGFNTFGSIPDGSFRTMPNLEYLDLQSVNLTSINEYTFTGLTKLHTLDLGFNRIKRVPTAAFRKSPHLKELHLNDQQTGNQLVVFEVDSFKNIENSIQRFFIGRNSLELNRLWSNVALFTSLVALDLKYINLNEIPDRAFANNANLTLLDISDNSIRTLTQETFYGPHRTLSSINIQNNKIETIDKCVFADFVSLPRIRLFGNPLRCDCQLAWLYDWVQKDNDSVSAAINYVGHCSSPPTLKDKFFFQFNRSELTCRDHVDDVCLPRTDTIVG